MTTRHVRSHTPRAPLNLSILPAFRPVLAPAAILLAAGAALATGPALPPSLSGLKTLGPYVVLLLGTGMGVWFNRGRAFIALASLLAAFAGYSFALEFGATDFVARAGDRPKLPEAGIKLRHLRLPRKMLSVTISVGVAELDEQRSTPAEVLRAADQALYRAKETGRNRVSL